MLTENEVNVLEMVGQDILFKHFFFFYLVDNIYFFSQIAFYNPFKTEKLIQQIH